MRNLVLGGASRTAYGLKRFLKGETVYVSRPELFKINLSRFIKKHKINNVINCAAYSDVDGCEKNKQLAYDINYKFAEKTVNALKKHKKVKFIHISTDYVFKGGKNKRYSEKENPDPVNFYGLSKLLADILIERALSNYIIIRTSGLYGAQKNDFIKWAYLNLKNKRKLDVDEYPYAAFTHIYDLAAGINYLIKKNFIGIINLTGQNVLSRYAAARFINKKYKLNCLVKKTKFKRAAKRPEYSALNLKKLNSFGFKTMSLKKGIDSYVNEIKER